MVSYDLGALGTKECLAVGYHWAMPSLMPLALLALKTNRSSKAW